MRGSRIIATNRAQFHLPKDRNRMINTQNGATAFALATAATSILVLSLSHGVVALSSTAQDLSEGMETQRVRVELTAGYDSSVTANISQHIRLIDEPAPGSAPEHDKRRAFESAVLIGLWTIPQYRGHEEEQFQGVEEVGADKGKPGLVISKDKYPSEVSIPLDEAGYTYFFVDLPTGENLVLTAAVRSKFVNESYCNGWIFARGHHPAWSLNPQNLTPPQNTLQLTAPYGIQCHAMNWWQENIPGPPLLLVAALVPGLFWMRGRKNG